MMVSTSTSQVCLQHLQLEAYEVSTCVEGLESDECWHLYTKVTGTVFNPVLVFGCLLNAA